MKKNRSLIAVLSVLIFLCGISVAEAALTLTETNDTAATVFYSWAGSPKTTDNVIQTFQATADGEITSIQAYIEDDEGDTGTSIIYLYGTWDTESAARSGCAGGTWLGRFDADSMPSVKTLITYSPNGGDRVATSTKYYCLQFRQSGSGYDGQQWIYGSTSNDYAEGMATTTAVFENPPDQMNGVVDLALIINGQASQHKDEIEISYPTTTAPQDFEDWEITFDTSTSTTATSTDAYVAYIYAAYNTSSTDYMLNTCGTACLRGVDIVHSFQSPADVVNNTTWGLGTIYAFSQLFYQPERFSNPDLIIQVATSSIQTINFTEGDFGGFFDVPTSTATSSQWTFTCDPDEPAYAYSLCKLFKWLFIPSSESLNRFQNIGDLVSEKPPFGYWTEIKGEINDISTTTAAFTFTGMAALSENAVFSTIKSTLTAILWFAFAFWVLHRVRKFDFHT